MSTATDEDRKEQARIKQSARDQLGHRKEYKRLLSCQRSREHKVQTTRKRFEEHTLEELLRIARVKCVEQSIDFSANENDITRILAILHGTANVQSPGI